MPKNHKGTRIRVILLSLGGAAFFASAIFVYTFGDSLNSFIAASTVPEVVLPQADNPEAFFAVKRKIQRHFLERKIYLPIDDIIFDTEPEEGDEVSRSIFLMREACGKARIYIWVPLAYKLPFTGRTVKSWCWTIK